MVQTPDLFVGRTFPYVHDGVAYADSVGEETLAARATEIVSPMAADLVYGGMPMGTARAAEQVLARARGEGCVLPLRRYRRPRGGRPPGPPASRRRPT